MENYKEKYENLIEKLKKAKEEHGGYTFSSVIDKIVHELRESEDERIREEIIAYLKDRDFDIEESWLAWLEKQGEQKTVRWDEGNALSVEGIIRDNGFVDFDCSGTSFMIPVENDFKNGDKVIVRIIKQKQGEQNPTDKIEAKFKVGDWCIDNEDDTIFQIVKVLDNTYTYKTNDGEEYSCTHYSLENDARLWSIQDAKDGDVLVTTFEEDNMIVMYHSMCTIDTINVHCCLDNKFTCANLGVFDAEDVKPATKEQRDLLFQVMKEAGYEWDAEKKELRKIEHRSLSTEETELNSLAFLTELGYTCIPPKKEKSSEWSKEDEEKLNSTIFLLKEFREAYQENAESCINWLKSLKPSWKPSEEQMKELKKECLAHSNYQLCRLLEELEKL